MGSNDAPENVPIDWPDGVSYFLLRITFNLSSLLSFYDPQIIFDADITDITFVVVRHAFSLCFAVSREIRGFNEMGEEKTR